MTPNQFVNLLRKREGAPEGIISSTSHGCHCYIQRKLDFFMSAHHFTGTTQFRASGSSLFTSDDVTVLIEC